MLMNSWQTRVCPWQSLDILYLRQIFNLFLIYVGPEGAQIFSIYMGRREVKGAEVSNCGCQNTYNTDLR